MKLIRNNTFETNSSSTHAIGVPKKSNYKKLSHVDFKWGEFGWEYKVYYDTFSKASYLYTMIRYFDGDYIPEFNKAGEYISKIRQYLDEERITYKFEEASDSTWGDGYVDHGAYSPEVIEGILKSKESFLTYLFDERAYVSTGNDNGGGYCLPEVGCFDDYCWSDDEEKYNNACKEYELDYDVYYKGN